MIISAYANDYKLSNHFTIGEFIISQTATRLGIPNYPNSTQFENMVQLCDNVLEPIRSHFGTIIVSSGLRTDALNTAIGGSKTSQHRKGEAADIVTSKFNITEMFEWIVLESGIIYDQVIHEFGRWIHISYTNDINYDNRMRNTTAMKVNNKTVYEHLTKEQIQKGKYLDHATV